MSDAAQEAALAEAGRIAAEVAAGLTLTEKAALLSGMDTWRLPPLARAGVPALVMSDGPSGVRGQSFVSGRSVCFPCGTALAATWDPGLVRDVGAAIGGEACRNGAHVVLGPTVNLHRHPLGGRNFECFSEDPELTAQMACAYIAGVQSRGAACCVKHLVCNDSEFERHTISSDVDETVLRELYLVPFEEAVRAGVWSVMASYNKLNGQYTSEHRWLLTRVLREEWRFEGVVISDWFGTHSTVEALHAGLDVEMPGPSRYRGEALLAAASQGRVPADDIERAAARVLTLIARTSGLEPGNRRRPDPAGAGTAGDPAAVARRAGARGMVLLKNQDRALPLAPGGVRTVALIGPGADTGQFQGGGSAEVSPGHVAGIWEALSAALGPVAEVRHERGCVLADWPSPLAPPLVATADGQDGVSVEYLRRSAPAGGTLAAETARSAQLSWIGQVVPGHDNSGIVVRVRAMIRPGTGGRYGLSVAGTGRTRVRVGGRLVADQPGEGRGRGVAAFGLGGARARFVVEFTEGVAAELIADFEPDPAKGMTRLEIGFVPPSPPGLMDRAVTLAAQADVAVVVAESPAGWETEGADRRHMGLPGRQDELIERVAAVNPRTVVVMNTGAPYAMPWAGRAAAIVQMWFPGQEIGACLADVLTGAVNPSGRLPVTFPVHERDAASSPFYPGTEGVVRYGEGLRVGYRAQGGARAAPPAFAFGHGLSYSSFRLGAPAVVLAGAGGERRYEVSVPVTHVDGPPGREVVQLYIASGDSSRPALELKGFAAVELRPGQTAPALITVPARKLRTWAGQGWQQIPGPVTARIGTSSADLPLTVTLPPAAGSGPA